MSYLLAIIAAVIWGLAYALDQKVLDKVAPFTLLFIHALTTVIVIMPFFFMHRKEVADVFTLDKTTLIFLFSSIVASVLAGLLILYAIQQLGASRAAIFEISYPFFVVIFSVLLYRSGVNAYFLLGSVFLFIGSAIIVLKG